MAVVTMPPRVLNNNSDPVETRACVGDDSCLGRENISACGHGKVESIVSADPKNILHEPDVARFRGLAKTVANWIGASKGIGELDEEGVEDE